MHGEDLLSYPDTIISNSNNKPICSSANPKKHISS